jgi:hypothetical protein
MSRNAERKEKRRGRRATIVISLMMATLVAGTIVYALRGFGPIEYARFISDDRMLVIHRPRVLVGRDRVAEVMIVDVPSGRVLDSDRIESSAMRELELQWWGPHGGYLWLPSDRRDLVAYPIGSEDPIREKIDFASVLHVHPDLGEGFTTLGTNAGGLVVRSVPGQTYRITPDRAIEVESRRVDHRQSSEQRWPMSRRIEGVSNAKAPGDTPWSLDELVLDQARIPTDDAGEPLWVERAGAAIVIGESRHADDRRYHRERLLLHRPDGSTVWNITARDTFGEIPRALVFGALPSDAVFVALRVVDDKLWAAIRGSRRGDEGSSTYHFRLVELDLDTGAVLRRVSLED